MRKRTQRSYRLKGVLPRLAGALGLILALGSLGAASAWGGYEQVADFGENELWRATGLAVNVTGAGGVEAGSVYAVSQSSRRVARYSPTGEFREAWGWGVDNGAAEYQRCGPEGEVAHPTCKPPFDPLPTGEGAGQFRLPYGIAVEQSTGRVYVLDGERQKGVVQVLSADGTEVLGSFGEFGVLGESFDEGPGKIHGVRESGIAVRNGGVAYVTDWKPPSAVSGFEERVMVFENGVYAGRDHDIAASPPAPSFKYNTFGLAVDDAGNLFTMGQDAIFAFSPADRLNPICEYDFSAGGLHSMTVDPTSGAPFFFSNKGKKEIHQLSPCNEGEFEEVATIAVSPQTTKLDALAFNPSLSYGPGRPPGTLYGADGEERSPQKGIGHIFAGAEAFPPVVESESVSSVTSSSAILGAQIDPKGFETRYAFQYLTAAAYEANEPSDRFAGAIEVPVGGALLGSGSEVLSASSAVIGLAPDTEYRYRAVATSHCQDGNPAAICEGAGEAESFRTFPAEAPGLPDNRAYELVSPAFKDGGEVFPLTPERASCGIECKPGALTQPFPRMSAPDGEAVVYEGQPFSLTEGATMLNQYLSRRTPTGWQTTTLAPKLMGGTLEGYKAFAADLSTGILLQGKPSLTPEAPSEVNNLYTQPTATPAALTPLLGATPPNRGPDIKLAYAGSSADFSRHFFAADDVLTGPTPFAPEALDGGTSKMNLYESAGGELRLVNVMPSNAEALPGAHFGAPALKASNYENSVSNLSHAISDDGSRVFWSDEAGQVYVREDGETTTQIPDPGKFLTASADGSKVLLRNGHLYDLETKATTDLTAGQGGFEGIAGQSEDLSRVYFVATSVLSGEEENDQGAKAQAGKFNLYAWEEGSLGFVATLLAIDDTFESGGTWNFSPAQRTAQASPDGRWLAFLSRAPLTGYDSVGPACERKQSGELITAPCREVFLYDAAAGELSCPSCNPANQTPLGPSGLQSMEQSGGREDPTAPARYLTDEGRLYFDSQDSLSVFDTNNRVEDVYQYQPQGVGTCKREGGCVNLISAGTGIVDSNFLAVDATGKNVFFTTRDQLLLRDRDELIDLYVAREGGGIPAETEVARGECQGEACLPAVSPPNDPALASSVFQGPGNVDEKKAAKKKKLKKRCSSTNRDKRLAFKPLLKAKCGKARKGKAKTKPKPQGRR